MNKSNFLILFSAALFSVVACGVSYKLGLDKGHIDNKPVWTSTARNEAFNDISRYVGYVIPESDVKEGMIRINPHNPKSLGAYLYEVNGIKTIITICEEPKCVRNAPPNYYD